MEEMHASQSNTQLTLCEFVPANGASTYISSLLFFEVQLVLVLKLLQSLKLMAG
jgi:hypothetical protein